MSIQEITAMAIMTMALVCMTIEDLLHKKISLWIIIVLGGLMLFVSIWQGNTPVFILTGLIPGAFALVFSKLTRGGFGLGDALLLLATGTFFGIWEGLAVLMTGLILSSVVGILLLIIKKAGLKTELPFIPFYFAGVVIWGIGRWI